MFDKFQCPACRLPLPRDRRLRSAAAGAMRPTDGILDFVGGRFDTQLDVDMRYDDYHGIDDGRRGDRLSRASRHLAADRWPESLGSVVEIGCGTGLVARDDRTSRRHRCGAHRCVAGHAAALPSASRRGSAWRPRCRCALPPIARNEACFRDAAFDTCIGTSVVHHITDVRAFLTDVWRILKPGGRAFFTEPSFRYTRVMAMAFADIIACSVVARLRLLRGPADIAQLGRRGPQRHDAAGRSGAPRRLRGQTYVHRRRVRGPGAGCGLRHGGSAVLARRRPTGWAMSAACWPGLASASRSPARSCSFGRATPTRFLALLHARDLSSGYLFWLTKSASPGRPVTFAGA